MKKKKKNICLLFSKQKCNTIMLCYFHVDGFLHPRQQNYFIDDIHDTDKIKSNTQATCLNTEQKDCDIFRQIAKEKVKAAGKILIIYFAKQRRQLYSSFVILGKKPGIGLKSSKWAHKGGRKLVRMCVIKCVV